MDPLTDLLGAQAAQMTETFLLRELQTSGVAKSPGEDGLNLTAGAYRLRFAESLEDLEAAYRLRFLVFNLELGEGLETAYEQGYDTDQFDAVCDHLIVEHCRTHQVVGTYRLQTGTSAARNLGYYSAREFDFTKRRDRLGEGRHFDVVNVTDVFLDFGIDRRVGICDAASSATGFIAQNFPRR